MRLLTDEELDEIGYPILPLGDRTGYRRVAQAQLDLDKQETEIIKNKAFTDGYNMGARDADTDNKEGIREIFEELEDYLSPINSPQNVSILLTLFKSDWQALKEKYLK